MKIYAVLLIVGALACQVQAQIVQTPPIDSRERPLITVCVLENLHRLPACQSGSFLRSGRRPWVREPYSLVMLRYSS